MGPALERQSRNRPTGPRYQPPTEVKTVRLFGLLARTRPIDQQQELRLSAEDPGGAVLNFAGDLSLVERRCVAIVGTRKVSPDGAKRARRLARELVQAGVVVVSGLAEGVDTEALTAAIEAGGKTIAVIGTPLDSAYPASNRRLQEQIYRDHLLVSQFPHGAKVFPGNFPARNKVMAAISDATVIVEASDTSGTLHQAAECTRLGRWLFILRSVVEDKTVTWPSKFEKYERTQVVSSTEELLTKLNGTRSRA